MDPTTSTPLTDSPSRTSDGKLQARDSAAGNKPGRGIMGSPLSDEGADAPAQKVPDAKFKGAMDAVLGKPKRVAAPGADDAAQDKPRQQQPRRKAPRPEPRQEADDETPGGDEGSAPEGPEDDDRKPEPRQRTTKRDADYSAPDDAAADEEPEAAGAGEDDGPEAADAADKGKPKASDIDRDFAARFNLPLDKAAGARNALIDDFAATLGGAGAQAHSAAQGNAPGTQPQGQYQNGNGQASGTPNGQPAQAAPGQRKQLTKEVRDAVIEQYGDGIAPVLDLIQQLTGDFGNVTQHFQQQRTREVQATIDRFMGSKVKAGFGERYGNVAHGLSPAHQFARRQLVDNAAAYQNAKVAGGGFVSDEDALEAAFQYLNRDVAHARAKEQGRRGVEQQVVQRHRTLDVSGATGAGPARGAKSQDVFANTLRTFVGGGRRR